MDGSGDCGAGSRSFPAYRSLKGEAMRSTRSDAWEKRILELSDGRTVEEIIDSLFREEVQRGGASADIGIWKGLFDRAVAREILHLVGRGMIHLADYTHIEEDA